MRLGDSPIETNGQIGKRRYEVRRIEVRHYDPKTGQTFDTAKQHWLWREDLTPQGEYLRRATLGEYRLYEKHRLNGTEWYPEIHRDSIIEMVDVTT